MPCGAGDGRPHGGRHHHRGGGRAAAADPLTDTGLRGPRGGGVATIVLTGVGIAFIGSAADRRGHAVRGHHRPGHQAAAVRRGLGGPTRGGDAAGRRGAGPSGEVVIRQGEPADRFYLIESGAFAVSRAEQDAGGPAILRRLGPDEAFGEIGLLQRSPRTATVTAESGRRAARARRRGLPGARRGVGSRCADACSGCTRAGPPEVSEDSTPAARGQPGCARATS